MRFVAEPDDPIEHVEMDDTSVEPLWVERDEPQRRDDEDAAAKTQFMPPSETQETQLMESVAYDADSTEVDVLIAGEAAEEAVATGGETQYLTSLDDGDGIPEDEPEPEAEAEPEPEAEAEPNPEPAPEPEPAHNEDEPEATPDEDDAPADHDQGKADVDQDKAPAEDSPSARPSRYEPEPLRTLQTIDVGMDDGWYDQGTRPHSSYRRRDYDREHRPSYSRVREQDSNPHAIWFAVGAAALALVIGLFVAHATIGTHDDGTEAQEETPVLASERVSKSDASALISSLDGWWKTDRTFDGRYWHLQDGLMEVYAADGKLASQTLLDPASVEHMNAGPGGIEGSGYYLRDVGYYLTDDDPNTLHAINQDGSADEAANLLRTESPDFVSEGVAATDVTTQDITEDASEYLLPEATTRVYDVSELESMSDHDLFVARNEIYARHGYVFETGELSTYFSSKSWYHPSDVFNEGEISEIERQNISTILSIEQSRGSQYV